MPVESFFVTASWWSEKDNCWVIYYTDLLVDYSTCNESYLMIL